MVLSPFLFWGRAGESEMVTQVNTPSQIVVLISMLIQQFTISNQVEGKSPKTVKWYGDILGQFVFFLKEQGHPVDLTSFSITRVREYIRYLQQRRKFQNHPTICEDGTGLSVETVRGHIRTLKVFSSWLHQEEYTEVNLLQPLKPPRAPQKLIEPLTENEIKTLVGRFNRDTYTGIRNQAIFTTLIDTGLRASEVAGITLNHLNMKDGCIKVMGKGSKERVVPIGKTVQHVLWSYIERTRPNVRAKNHLFLSRGGKPIAVNAVKLMFSRLAKDADIPRLHAHLCRHTFAINYLLNGGDIFSLKEILGHASLDMVMRYLHFTSSQITARHHQFSPMDRLSGDGS